jgi:hypothetical protein
VAIGDGDSGLCKAGVRGSIPLVSTAVTSGNSDVKIVA